MIKTQENVNITEYRVGYIGYGPYKAKINRKYQTAYNTWKSIIRRCYYSKDANKFPAYFGICTMCDEWLNYQNFAKWFEENKIKVDGRLHIDKDILCPGNHLYSPEKCLLIPQRINMLFTNTHNKKNLPNGISKQKGKYFAKYNSLELGCADSLEGAYTLYANAKEAKIKEVATEYKDIISEKAYNALVNYKVDIRNDKNYNDYVPHTIKSIFQKLIDKWKRLFYNTCKDEILYSIKAENRMR